MTDRLDIRSAAMCTWFHNPKGFPDQPGGRVAANQPQHEPCLTGSIEFNSSTAQAYPVLWRQHYKAPTSDNFEIRHPATD
jgi:hypothetical protein